MEQKHLVYFCAIISLWTISTESKEVINSPFFMGLNEAKVQELNENDTLIRTESLEFPDDYDDEFVWGRVLKADHEWDLLIFTQQWPVTTCFHWRESDKNHACKLPQQKEFWTIHGIWPTKLGHMGPSFCNKTAEFDENKLKDIENDLNEYWPDIDGEDANDDNWLWKHEWLKHGTCAALLDELNNELKYFGQGINWRESFSIANMLGNAGIHPDSNNTVVAIQTALLNSLGKNPSIHCLYDDKKDVSYLSEIRLCFDKQLQLTNCDGVKRGDVIQYPGGTLTTNCHIAKPVHYPSLVPSMHREAEKKWEFPVVNIYKLLQFMMWSTL